MKFKESYVTKVEKPAIYNGALCFSKINIFFQDKVGESLEIVGKGPTFRSHKKQKMISFLKYLS